MSDEIYYKLRDLLDSIPNGYPPTEDGLEIKILKKIFTEEEAEVATKLKLKYESPEGIALRTGLDKEYLEKILKKMVEKGQIFGFADDDNSAYRLLPFVMGIYEFQLNRLDRELVEMIEEYLHTAFGDDFHSPSHSPSLMRVVSIEEEVPRGTDVEPYERLTKLLESAASWGVAECICKKEKGMLGERCEYPIEVCLGMSPLEDYFEDFFWGRAISKEEALDVLKKSEDVGLIHLTANTKEGNIYICNCCGCCCGMLRGIIELDNLDAVAHSNYVAVVDEDICSSCGDCLDRCHVEAITIDETAIVNERCIGCGLCITKCPVEAIKLVKREEGDILDVPENQYDWWEKRGKASGRNKYKDLLE